MVGLAAAVAVAVVAGGVAVLDSEPDAAISAATEDDALDTARRTGSLVRIDALTSENTEVYARPDGQYEAHLAAGAVRVRRGSGWVPVDLTLHAAADGTVAPAAHPYGLTLSGKATAGRHELAAVGEGTSRVAMSWPGRLPAPTLRGSTATYAEVLTGVDLVVEATRAGFSQSLIVKNRAAIDRVQHLVLPLSGPGAATFRQDAAGAITLARTNGTATTTVPPPSMWDSRTTPAGTPARTAAIRTSAARTAGGIALTLTPDVAWLRDRRTVFPVTLDPSVNPLATTFDTYVRDTVTTDQSAQKDLQFGLLATTPTTLTRAFVTWNSTVLSGKQITAATVKFWNFWSGGCTAKSWEIWPTTEATTATRYRSQPAWLGTAPLGTSTSTKGGTGCTDDDWATIDGKAFFQYFATARSAKAFMGLRATDETDTAAFKQFRSRDGDAAAEVPTASITYNAYPVVSARATVPASACATGADRPLVNSLTPQLKATVTDADNSPSVEFEWWAVDGTAKIGGAKVDAVATGGTATVTVPAGAFTDGGRYKWRVLASDGVAGSSAWSSFCEMTTWVTLPPVTGCTPGTPNDYNGDGVEDLAVGDPEALVGTADRAGTVTVRYGGTATVQVLRQGQDGVPDGPENGDQFGFALATYDANRDGCSDLMVGVPGESVGTAAAAGAATLLLGSPAGLSRGPAGVGYDQNVTGWGDDAEAGDQFGSAVAAGNLPSGEAWMAVGVPGEDVGTVRDAGLIHYGRGTTVQTLSEGSGAGGKAEPDDRFGFALSGSLYHLAVGVPGKTVNGQPFAGQVQLLSQELAAGLPKPVATVDQTGTDTPEANDMFGKSVAIAAYRETADAAGAAVSFLLAGVPGEDVGNVVDAGLVQRYRVTATGAFFRGRIAQDLRQDGVLEEGDYFGEQVRIVNTAPALVATAQTLMAAAGAPGEDLGGVADAGQVSVFGAASDPVVPSNVDLDRRAGAIPGTGGERELIGAWLGASPTRLYVGSPYRDDTVYGFGWSDLAQGGTAPAVVVTAGAGGVPAGRAFGTAVG
jgi:hypothetical protein